MLFGIKLIAVLFCLAFSSPAYAGEVETAKCRELISFIGNDLVGKVDCYDQYHHLNSQSSKLYSKAIALEKKKIKIASFNVYNLGSTRTEFKDNTMVAEIINGWDIVGAQEIFPIIGRDARHNRAIVKLLKKLKSQYNDLISQDATESELLKLQAKISLVTKQFHKPGFVLLLLELQKLDPSWSLILSGDEEGTKSSTVLELAGYFYRGSVIEPISNEYCSKIYDGTKPYACTVKFSKEFFGRDISDLIARRPFMGSFRSGNFDFTLLSSHIIHNSPGSNKQRLRILKEAYDLENYKDIGYGVGKSTFARFAEVKHILKFVALYKEKFKEQDVIMLGDFNLKGKEKYWPILLESHPEMKVKISKKTSIARGKFTSGRETKGVKNNYDHFIFDDVATSECAGEKNPRVFNFLENKFKKRIDTKYLVRSEESYKDPNNERLIKFYYAKDGETKQNSLVTKYISSLKNKYTVSNGKLVKRYDNVEKSEDMLRTLFTAQLNARSYYRIYREVISDHLPIFMECNNSYDND